jgi:hypothetical protein
MNVANFNAKKCFFFLFFALLYYPFNHLGASLSSIKSFVKLRFEVLMFMNGCLGNPNKNFFVFFDFVLKIPLKEHSID